MTRRTIIDVKHVRETPGVTYQLEWIFCGKGKCKKPHGPYWYAYWKSGNRTRTRYVGKKFKRVSPLELSSRTDTPSPAEASRAAR